MNNSLNQTWRITYLFEHNHRDDYVPDSVDVKEIDLPKKLEELISYKNKDNNEYNTILNIFRLKTDGSPDEF